MAGAHRRPFQGDDAAAFENPLHDGLGQIVVPPEALGDPTPSPVTARSTKLKRVGQSQAAGVDDQEHHR